MKLHTGTTIHYSDVGQGMPLILAHGFMLDQSMFRPVGRQLKSHCRLVTWDARGHGRSIYEGNPFSQRDNAEDLLALMDELGIERAVVGGHSQGGYIAMIAALRHPQRLSGLVLINSSPHAQAPATLRQLETFTAKWRQQGPTEALCREIGAMVLGTARLDPWIDKWMAEPDRSLMNPLKAVIGRDDLTSCLDQIDIPTLVIHSSRDTNIPLAEAEDYAQRLAGALPIHVVDGAPHASCVTHPVEVAGAILAFLEKLGHCSLVHHAARATG